MTNLEAAMAKDLEVKRVSIVGYKNGDGTGDPVVLYANKYKGTAYVHIRTVYNDRNGVWCPGKGVAVNAEGAKDMLQLLGQAAAEL
jgi:hypothetical protein